MTESSRAVVQECNHLQSHLRALFHAGKGVVSVGEVQGLLSS